jgi:hypothetical protein
MKPCETCGDAPAVIRGQCRACDVYERRNGRRRSPEILIELERRRIERAHRAFERDELGKLVRRIAGGPL